MRFCRLPPIPEPLKADRRQDQGGVLRIGRQPLGNITDFEKTGRNRPPPRCAAHCGQHRALSLPLPPLRAWRRHRGAADQLHGRPRSPSAASSSTAASSPGPSTNEVPRLNEPDVSYHGVVHTGAPGPAAYIGRARVVPLRNMGAAISPSTPSSSCKASKPWRYAWTASATTAQGGEFLRAHAKVGWVNYAACPTTRTSPGAEIHGRQGLGHPSLGVKGTVRRRWPLPGRASIW